MRSSITIPLETWKQVNSVIEDYISKCATQLVELNETATAEVNVDETKAKVDAQKSAASMSPSGEGQKAKQAASGSPSEGSGVSEDVDSNFVRVDETGDDAN